MLLTPHLILYRRQLIRGIAGSLLAVILTAVDLILYSRGAPNAADTAYHTRLIVMLSSNVAAVLLAINLGLRITGRVPGISNEARFLLTRPISRLAIQLYPLAIAVAAIALLPVLGWLVVLCFLWMLQTHSFMAVASAFALGTKPSILQLIYAWQTSRGYLAALAAGLSLYGPMAASSWFLLNRSKTIRFLGFAGLLMIFAPMTLIPFMFDHSPIVAWIWLLPLKQGVFICLPSNTAIALHFVFAAIWIGITFYVLREAEA